MAESSSNLGPVELVVFTFPGTRVDPTVRAAMRDVVNHGYATVLDLIYLFKDANGYVTEVEIDEPLDEIGLGGLAVDARELVSEEDVDLVRSTMNPDTSAVVVVYEQTWARRLADAVIEARGDVALHVQVPRTTVEAALAVIEKGCSP